MNAFVRLLVVARLIGLNVSVAATGGQPLASESLVFEERVGIVAVEAEHFYKQTLTEKRAWHVTSPPHSPDAKPDGDPAHLAGASGGAYLECLPDTRRTESQRRLPVIG